MTEKILSPDGNDFSRRVSDAYVADVLIKNKKTFTATGLTISAFKGGQMYRNHALPFRLREFSAKTA
ncbi:hypothetical protein KKI90_09000 [Xenorhabdus bovienii]|uniref:hypothetical protein n=1 Tax=Xenorhabdus bovienii TaxID=40576 RepID=UPI0002E24AD1|nr:hypothetical protein [Xenorhabdus bovienii]MDE1486580.1 hypothetical protein [Xenorhabdus bovienii]MDE1496446.1 hypothetical protein [Xenorhabdus bovienii]MDE9447161.1 hypothetical protein [Xenorhabdus bovienii]MDE9474420.1 hypothetical protein [Xenorhabdus bovienii]MDE9477200.1 hypothetical protein [Xenorhabdus bovienii]